MKITREMVMELNNELAVKGCPFRYEYEGGNRIFTYSTYGNCIAKYELC